MPTATIVNLGSWSAYSHDCQSGLWGLDKESSYLGGAHLLAHFNQSTFALIY